MAMLTGALYGCLIFFGLGWYLGYWSGNFPLLLLVLTGVTGLYWMAEKLWFLPRRRHAVTTLVEAESRRAEELKRQGIQKVDVGTAVESARERLLAQPWWLDWTAGLFPVILLVFVLRSFLFEPFKIPSGSMIPTLEIGDLILVNKFHYGIRLPVLNRKVIENHPVQRGDVMVFRYPVDPSVDYIKRVVGIPGDEIAYINQKLSINGQPVPLETMEDYYDEDRRLFSHQFTESLGDLKHRILVDPTLQSSYGMRARAFPGAENCRYTAEGVTCKVPAGHYFMMGDNQGQFRGFAFLGFCAGREHRRTRYIGVDEFRQSETDWQFQLRSAPGVVIA